MAKFPHCVLGSLNNQNCTYSKSRIVKIGTLLTWPPFSPVFQKFFKMWSEGFFLLKSDNLTASDLVWNQIFANSHGPKMSFLAIFEVLNFDFSNLEQLSSPKFAKIQSSEYLKLPKITFLDRFNSQKFNFT